MSSCLLPYMDQSHVVAIRFLPGRYHLGWAVIDYRHAAMWGAHDGRASFNPTLAATGWGVTTDRLPLQEGHHGARSLSRPSGVRPT